MPSSIRFLYRAREVRYRIRLSGAYLSCLSGCNITGPAAVFPVLVGDLFVSKKFKYGKYDFPYDQIIDETTIGQLTGAVRLRILTVAADLYNAGDQMLLMRSQLDNEAILRLSDKYPYFDDLENAAKIRKYVKSRNVAQLPEAIQHIIRGKQQQATTYEKTAREHISSAILEAKLYVAGETSVVKASTVKDKIETALAGLVESVYAKLGYVKHNFDNDAELLQILSNQNKQMSMGAGMSIYNPEAVDEVDQFLKLQDIKMLPTSMGDIQRRFSAIPYGWREIDIAAVVCTLVATQKVALHYSGSMIQPTDKRNKGEAGFNLHMCFYGNPGTGKTEVARILSRILYDAGVLAEAKLVETDGRGLLGKFVGETAPKTEAKIDSAMGGVLFIDEAYALVGSHTANGGATNYGEEAIAVLLKEMEDRRGQFCAILAGYKDEMRGMLSANPGFESRIQFTLDFPDYSRDELGQIAVVFLNKKKYTIAQAALELLLDVAEYYRTQKNFSNARTIRNILDQVIMNQNLRTEDTEGDSTIIRSDVEEYITDENIDMQKKTAQAGRIGFI